MSKAVQGSAISTDVEKNLHDYVRDKLTAHLKATTDSVVRFEYDIEPASGFPNSFYRTADVFVGHEEGVVFEVKTTPSDMRDHFAEQAEDYQSIGIEVYAVIAPHLRSLECMDVARDAVGEENIIVGEFLDEREFIPYKEFVKAYGMKSVIDGEDMEHIAQEFYRQMAEGVHYPTCAAAGRHMKLLTTGGQLEKYKNDLQSGDLRVGMFHGDEILDVTFSGGIRDKYEPMLESSTDYIGVGWYREYEGQKRRMRPFDIECIAPLDMF